MTCQLSRVSCLHDLGTPMLIVFDWSAWGFWEHEVCSNLRLPGEQSQYHSLMLILDLWDKGWKYCEVQFIAAVDLSLIRHDSLLTTSTCLKACHPSLHSEKSFLALDAWDSPHKLHALAFSCYPLCCEASTQQGAPGSLFCHLCTAWL